MEVGANLIGMVKTNTKLLCKGAIEKFTKDWPGGSYLVKDTSLWYLGTGRLFLLDTSITRGSFYLLLLQTTQLEHRKLFPIYISILNNLLMFPFVLLLVPL